MNILKGLVYLTESTLLSTLLRKKTHSKNQAELLVITYNRFLPNITKTIQKNWNILQIHENFKEFF